MPELDLTIIGTWPDELFSAVARLAAEIPHTPAAALAIILKLDHDELLAALSSESSLARDQRRDLSTFIWFNRGAFEAADYPATVAKGITELAATEAIILWASEGCGLE